MLTFKRGSVKSADLNIRIAEGAIWMKFTDDGVPGAACAEDPLESIRHRIRDLGGTVDSIHKPDGTTILTACIPMPAASL